MLCGNHRIGAPGDIHSCSAPCAITAPRSIAIISQVGFFLRYPGRGEDIPLEMRLRPGECRDGVRGSIVFFLKKRLSQVPIIRCNHEIILFLQEKGSGQNIVFWDSMIFFIATVWMIQPDSSCSTISIPKKNLFSDRLRKKYEKREKRRVIIWLWGMRPIDGLISSMEDRPFFRKWHFTRQNQYSVSSGSQKSSPSVGG